jgi:hypothetical protein
MMRNKAAKLILAARVSLLELKFACQVETDVQNAD